MSSTTSRLLTLLSLLQTRRDWPGQLLADRLEISDRTVRRDVDRLREMGYRIHAVKGPEGGYRLEAGSELPPLLFDDEQALAIAVALQSATATGAGIEEAALRALTTVRQVMPSRLRHRLDGLQFTALPTRAGGASSPVSPEVLIALSAAVRAREVLRFDYALPDRNPNPDRDPDLGKQAPAAPRRVEPHHLVTTEGRWYLVAWDLERGAWRTFRADRITPRIPTGPRFASREVPGGDVRSFVAARFKGSDQVDEWPCRGSVILHLPATAIAPYVEAGSVEDLGDGLCRLSIGAWSWVALAGTIARFDAEFDVEGPQELVDAIDELSARFGRTAERVRGRRSGRATH